MGSFWDHLFGAKPDFKNLIDKGAAIIDVRTKEEFRAGHISGSRNYPLDGLDMKTEELKKLRRPIIAVCRSGARSAAAVAVLKRTGIEAYNGGGWMKLEKAMK